jgi:homeodomain-containing protein
MFIPTLCVVSPAADRAQLAQVVANGNTATNTGRAGQHPADAGRSRAPIAYRDAFGAEPESRAFWLRRYVTAGVGGVLHDAPRPGRRKRITADQVATIVDATLRTRPPPATHWSTRTMAKAQGVSEGTIRRIWRQHGLQPHRVTPFKLSKDPRFVDKLRDVVGLYLNPRDKAMVFCVDEKSGIQAPDLTRPVLPLPRKVPERQTHDYIRHGTTCL